MVTLPLIAPSPCAACRGPCCAERSVSLSAFDLCRLMDAFAVSWQEVALAGMAFSGGGFRLDATSTRWNFRLRQRASGRCMFAVGDEYVRCAAHAVRPASCRIYPFYIGLRDDGVRVAVGNNAACPPSLAMAWSELDAPALVAGEIAEHARYQDVILRWESQLSGTRDSGEASFAPRGASERALPARMPADSGEARPATIEEFLRFAREAM